MKTPGLLEELGRLVSAEARQELLEEVRPGVDPAVFERLRRVLEGTGKLLELVEYQRISVGRLCHLLFGPRTEKGPAVGGDPTPPGPKPPAPGHGRRSHRQYTGARRRRLQHQELRPGQPCPGCRRGKLRLQKQPATTVHLSAQPPVGAVVHERERLRCDTCGERFTAPAPPEAQAPKFDPSVGVMVGLLRYGSGMPLYRLERLQQSVGVP
jgi:transposase